MNDVPDNPVPIVKVFVVFAVTVADPPRDIDEPFTVTELLANIVFVTDPVSPVVTIVPLTFGTVNVLVVPVVIPDNSNCIFLVASALSKKKVVESVRLEVLVIAVQPVLPVPLSLTYKTVPVLPSTLKNTEPIDAVIAPSGVPTPLVINCVVLVNLYEPAYMLLNRSDVPPRSYVASAPGNTLALALINVVTVPDVGANPIVFAERRSNASWFKNVPPPDAAL